MILKSENLKNKSMQKYMYMNILQYCIIILNLNLLYTCLLFPPHHRTGMFSLTPDHGLRFIAKCTEKGFHPHPKHPVIYEEGDHTQVVASIESEVIDLR